MSEGMVVQVVYLITLLPYYIQRYEVTTKR